MVDDAQELTLAAMFLLQELYKAEQVLFSWEIQMNPCWVSVALLESFSSIVCGNASG